MKSSAESASAGSASSALERVARMYGVMPSYEESPGRFRKAEDDTLVAVLAALGAPIRSLADAREAERARLAEERRRLLGPVTVSWSDRPPLIGVAPLPGIDRLDCRLVLEDGEVHEWRVDLDSATIRRSHPAQGGSANETQVQGYRFELPGEVPLGYHDLHVRAGNTEARTRVIRAPRRAWTRGEADFGFFLPLHALRTARSWGTADLTDLRALVDWSARHGGSFVGTLPLLASFLGGGDSPFDPSPYAPVSRLFWNELYLDVERAPGIELSPGAQEMLGSAALREEVRRLRDEKRVRYSEAMAVKRRVLESVATAVMDAGDSAFRTDLERYAHANPDAVAYARFRAEMEGRGSHGARVAEADGRVSPAESDPWASPTDSAAAYHLYVQWAMSQQIADLPNDALYLDVPLGTHAQGFDVTRFPELFVRGLSVGAPPDLVFAGGQNWAFPPLHPEQSRENGHEYFARSLRHVMRPSRMIRLDHVMSLHRLFCIPDGAPHGEGAYVRYPYEELYAVVCLESHRAQCQVVGEDLGTVPAEVREAMAKHGLQRMYVLPFELKPAPEEPHAAKEAPTAARETPKEPFTKEHFTKERVTKHHFTSERLAPAAVDSVASLNTHDLPPFAAYCRREGLGPADSLRSALLLLAALPSRHLLINVEDLWLETEPQNQPGTSGDENWTRKAAHPLESWDDLPGLRELLAAVAEARRVPDTGPR